jgi:2-succinyl-5-enolpyruvyl-6-hydroxy-3-cyclohexene-1-carboxylate synthase
VAEAYYQGIPLIVVSADRPQQWIDQDDSQTIRQFEALSNFVKKSFDIPDFPATDKEMLWYANRCINEAIITASTGKPGPVHINMQFNAPLTRSGEPIAEQRIMNIKTGRSRIEPDELRSLAEMASNSKILICAGFMPPEHKLSRAIQSMLAFPNVYLLSETLANIKISGYRSGIDRIISYADSDTLKELSPDIVITLGGALVSRKVKEWLRKSPNTRQWALDKSSFMSDCFQKLSLKIEADAAIFLSGLSYWMGKLSIKSDWQKKWLALSEKSLISQREFVHKAPWCDLKVFDYIFSKLPSRVNVQCSNGTPIRYAELFACESDIHALYCNRGTSGIEGCTATAIGASEAYKRATLFITGDMSFMHDLGALAMHEIPSRLKIIVINNGGGDIFRFISTTASLESREELFCCPQQSALKIKSVSEIFGFKYFCAESESELIPSFSRFINSTERCILEIRTIDSRNAEILNEYMNRNL